MRKAPRLVAMQLVIDCHTKLQDCLIPPLDKMENTPTGWLIYSSKGFVCVQNLFYNSKTQPESTRLNFLPPLFFHLFFVRSVRPMSAIYFVRKLENIRHISCMHCIDWRCNSVARCLKRSLLKKFPAFIKSENRIRVEVLLLLILVWIPFQRCCAHAFIMKHICMFSMWKSRHASGMKRILECMACSNVP